MTKKDSGFSGILGSIFGSKRSQTYVVVDLETTSLSPRDGEIIEIGAVKFDQDNEAACFSTLVRPKYGIPRVVTELTGISNIDVQRAPELDAVLPQLMSFIGNCPIVAHNAGFDVYFLLIELMRRNSTLPNDVFDTLEMSRIAFPGLPAYRLQDLKESLDLGDYQSHRSLSDARCTAALFRQCQSRNRGFKPHPISDYARRFKHEDLTLCPPRWPNRTAKDFCSSCDPETIPKTCPLYGKTVVFTGEFSVYVDVLRQIAVDCGAVLGDRVTQKTDFLVEGWQDVTIVGDDGLSRNQEKAQQYNAEGKTDIQFLNEQEFLQLANTY